MDAGVPIVTADGKPTRELMAQVNDLRTLSTDPWLNANTVIADRMGRPTRAFIALLNALLGEAPNAHSQIAEPKTGLPTRSFISLVNV